jgi:hypothetical protein
MVDASCEGYALEGRMDVQVFPIHFLLGSPSLDQGLLLDGGLQFVVGGPFLRTRRIIPHHGCDAPSTLRLVRTC